MGSLSSAIDSPSWVETMSPIRVNTVNTSSSASPSNSPIATCSMAVSRPAGDSGSSTGGAGNAALSTSVSASASSTRTRTEMALWLNSGARLNTAMIRQNGHQ
ncbi:hypothetical protein D3C77_572670 [compost metagenome]